MNIGILLISMLCFCYVSIHQSLHMFQQNRYQIKRYGNWCRKQVMNHAFSLVHLIWEISFVGVACLNQSNRIIEVLSLLLFVYSYIFYQAYNKRSVISPLVYTSRMKRLLSVYIVLLLGWFTLSFQCLPITLFTIFMGVQFFVPWILIIVAHVMMMPLERWIQNWYVKDAKRILLENKEQLRIGITGSFGKTSTKNILYHILSEQYYCFKTPKSYNNLMGITRSIREHLKPIHEIFICEMGSDHVGEIERLVTFVSPKIGVVSAIGPQHLQTFHSIENIIFEKMQLVERLPKDGLAVLNMDNDYIRNYHIKNNSPVIYYGIHQYGADVRAYDIHHDETGTFFSVDIEQQTYQFHTKLLGEHNVLNILAALSIGWYLHIPWDTMVQAVASIPFVKHRLSLNHQFHFTLIDDAYNSNPVSARLALQVLKDMPGRHLLITPGFIDLGSIENEENRLLGTMIPQYADVVILVGEKQTRYIQKGLLQANMQLSNIHIVDSTKAALALCMRIATAKDCVLLENDLPDAFNH